MTEQVVEQTAINLADRFPGIVRPDTRPAFQGYIVETDHLLEVARIVRDELGYDYLTSVTAVDYLPEGKFEVVYHVLKTTGGPVLCYKVQTPRECGLSPQPGTGLPGRRVPGTRGLGLDGSAL